MLSSCVFFFFQAEDGIRDVAVTGVQTLCSSDLTLDAYAARIENFTTGQLPAGTTRLNPKYQPWTAPSAVPAGSRAAVEAAVLSALAVRGSTVQNGLTRLPDGRTAIVLSFGNAGTVDEWGVEFGSTVSLSRTLTVSGSYTWYNSAIRDNLGGNVRNVIS